MTELHTGLLLGLYALLAGLYGASYAAGRVAPSRMIDIVTVVFCAIHIAVFLAIAIWTPLGFVWKSFLGAGSAVLIAIPPLTWRLLQETHASEPDS